MDGKTLQQKTTTKGRKNSKLQDLKRQEGGGECIWNISEQIQGTTVHRRARPKVVRNIVFTCVVLHNMLRTHQGGAHTAPAPANDVEALRNEQVVYVPDDNYRNLSREAKYQRDQLKDYFNHFSALTGQEDKI